MSSDSAQKGLNYDGQNNTETQLWPLQPFLFFSFFLAAVKAVHQQLKPSSINILWYQNPPQTTWVGGICTKGNIISVTQDVMACELHNHQDASVWGWYFSFPSCLYTFWVLCLISICFLLPQTDSVVHRFSLLISSCLSDRFMSSHLPRMGWVDGIHLVQDVGLKCEWLDVI